MTGSRHADTIIDGVGPSLWRPWRCGTDRPLMLIGSGRCQSWVPTGISAFTAFSYSKGFMHPKNWPCMFLFVWGSCWWPSDPNIGGIVRKAVIWGSTLRSWYPGFAPYLHHLQCYIWRILDPWWRFDHLSLLCVGVVVGGSCWLSVINSWWWC